MNVRQVAVLMMSVYLRDDRMTALREAELRCPPQELIVPFLERGVPLPRDRYVPQAGATTWSHAGCHFFLRSIGQALEFAYPSSQLNPST